MSTVDRWTHLRGFTAARIAIGRAGGSAPTRSVLDFRLDHARARDAVLTVFEPEALDAALQPLGVETILLESEAHDRSEYLQRPDKGRLLSAQSRAKLAGSHADSAPDLVIILSDG